MNIKISQLPIDYVLNGKEVFPILDDGKNFSTPVSAVYTFLSGNNIIEVYQYYINNKNVFETNNSLISSVYTNYRQNSSLFVKSNSSQVYNWNQSTTYVQNNSSNINNVLNNFSSYFLTSDPTLVPGSSAINNIIAISQDNFNNLTYIDPQTYYVISS